MFSPEFAFSVKKKLEGLPTTLNLQISSIPVRKTRFEKVKKIVKTPKLPWELAQEWQSLHGIVSLDILIEEYLDSGYIWSLPNLFMLAKELHWNNSTLKFEEGEHPNAWFVGIGVTKDSKNPVKELLKMAPHRLEWVVWMRRGKYKAYKWDNLATKVKL